MIDVGKIYKQTFPTYEDVIRFYKIIRVDEKGNYYADVLEIEEYYGKISFEPNGGYIEASCGHLILEEVSTLSDYENKSILDILKILVELVSQTVNT